MLADGQSLTSRYRIIRQLNTGGMGAVYEAFDTILDAPVAIKENLLEDENMRVAFQREAQLLANLHHPSLPHCSDLLTIGKGQYLVLEFIEGDDLATMMAKTQTPLPNETIMDWARQMLDVLDYLHRQSVLHRDIKPANIKVKNGCVYLLDFGLAYGQSGEMNTVATKEFNWHCHSPKYSPLEQLRCERTTPASDLYSLAATLYKLLTTVPPDDAEHRFQSLLRGEVDPLKDIRLYNRDADENIRRTVMQALSLNINHRPQSAQEMRQMMFPEKAAQPKPKAAQKFRSVGRLAGIFTLGLLSGLLLFVFKFAYPNPAYATSNPALRCDEQVVGSNPVEQASQLTDKAEQLQQSGKDEEAKKKIEASLALDPNNPYALFIKGDLLWDAKAETAEFVAQITEVQELADMILRAVRSPRTAKEYIARAWANYAKGRLDDAIADANHALESNRNSVAALMIRASAKFGKIAINNKTVSESLAGEILNDYNEVIRLMPNYAQAHVNRGDIYLRLGQPELALASYGHALSLMPRASTYSKIGKLYFMRQNYVAARSNFQKAMAINQNYYRAYIGLADVFFQEEDWSNAEKYYLAANKINKTQYVFKKLGDTYQHLNQLDYAAANYKLAQPRSE